METFFDRKTTTFDVLPSEVLSVIFHRLVSSKEVNTARQVCRKWRSVIDSDLPLAITIDGRQRGSCAFARRVVKREVRLKNLSYRSHLCAFKNPRRAKALEKLTVDGTIHPQLFSLDVTQFQYLKQLLINGIALTDRIELEALSFPCLETLQLYSPFSQDIKAKVPGEDLRRYSVRVAKNTYKFLANINCPRIKRLLIDGDVDQIKIPDMYDWKNEVFISFLERYKDTLKTVLVGESCIFKSLPSRQMTNLPKGLISLHFSFYGNHIDPQDTEILWNDFVAAQRQLENLNFGALWFRHISTLLATLPVSMKYVSVYWNVDDSNTFDVGILSKLVNLERLEITFDGNAKQRFMNFDRIQECSKLKVLVTEQGRIPTTELEKFPVFFPKLEVLYLYRCAQHQHHNIDSDNYIAFGISTAAFTKFLNMRRLEYLFMTQVDFIGDQLAMESMAAKSSLLAQEIQDDEQIGGYHIGSEPIYPDPFLERPE